MSGSTKKSGTRFTRGQALAAAAVTVALAVAAIVLLTALGPTRGVKAPENDSRVATQAAALADQASAALASGDTTRAIALGTQALALDSNNTSAKSTVEKAKAKQSTAKKSGGSSPSSGEQGSATPDTDGSGSDAPVDGASFDKDITELAGLLPLTFDNHALGDVTTTEGEAQVSATPISGKALDRQVIWAIHKSGSAGDAKSFIEKTSKESYAEDASSFTVDKAQAYFGTDGTQYATAVYVRGRYVFEVLVATSGGDPAALRSVAEAASKGFADGAP